MTRIFFLLGHQVAGDVLRVFDAQAQARHHRHVLDLQFVPIVGQCAVLEIKDVRQTFFRIVLGADVFFLQRAVRARTLPRVVDPAD